MPDGRTHQRIALVTTPLFVLGAWTASGFPLLDVWRWGNIGAATAGYLTNPFCLSPDMDLPQSLPSKRWGVLQPLLWPYQMLIHQRGGRNPFSHWPPLSALLRVASVWLTSFLVFCFGIFIIDLIGFGLWEEILIPPQPLKWLRWWFLPFRFWWFWSFLLGLCVGDLVHWLADVICSFMVK